MHHPSDTQPRHPGANLASPLDEPHPPRPLRYAALPAGDHRGTRFPDVTLSVSSADSLPFPDDHFDCVILGFVLCWCDRDDLFRIAAEVDRVLRADGYIAILDFQPDFPHAREYAHRQGLSTFKMDYASLWSWHPRYRQVYRELTAHPGKAIDDPDERLAVTVLQG